MPYLILFIALLLIPSTVSAQETSLSIQPSHSMTMHGESFYKEGFTHFKYTNPNAPKGGTLKLHSIGSFDSLNPFIVKGESAAGLSFLGNSNLYNALMVQSYDEAFSMYCLICENVERDPNNMFITFNLNSNARWHDGQPITAHDIVWTFNTLFEKGLPFYKAYYGDVDTVSAENDTRVTFTFKHNKNAELPLILGQLTILPKHYWTAEGRDLQKTSLIAPLGSGPYKVKSVSPGRRITYERVKDYWAADLPAVKGQHNFDEISYEYFRDANVALEAFFAGQYDVRQENIAKLWANAYDTPQVNDGRITKAEISHKRPQGMQAFVYNVRRPVFSDPAVRKALAYAFDFEWSNKQFAFSSYKRTNNYFSNSELASSGLPQGRELEILNTLKAQFPDAIPPQVFTEEYKTPQTDGSGKNRKNLREAIKILDEAGWVIGESGVREKDGVQLKFEILESNPQFERWTLPFIKNMKRLGVEASFRVVDSAQYQNRIQAFDYDMSVLSMGQSSSPGNEQREYWGSEKADIEGSRNYMGIKNPAIDSLIEDLIQAKSREDLVAHTHALDRILLWNHYLIPQWHVGHWRIAWWSHIEKPDTLSDNSPLITTTWWAKPDQSQDQQQQLGE